MLERPLPLHYSGDQCSATGQILWTTDSSRFLLLGQRFCVQKSGELPNGQKLFFMHDVRTGQSWCNNVLSNRCDEHPPFSSDDLAGLSWNNRAALDGAAAMPGPARTAPR
jgi:hypothetical protein